MPKVVNLSQPAAIAKVVDLSRPAPTRGEKIIRTLGLVGLVAGTIAAGAVAAHSHAKSNGGSK
jgi:hypothetical protein